MELFLTGKIVLHCINAIGNLAVLLDPFLPFSSRKISAWLGIDNKWEYKKAGSGGSVGKPELLFKRIDKKMIDIELKKLIKAKLPHPYGCSRI